MKIKQLILPLLIFFTIGGVVYYNLFWDSLASWILEEILTPFLSAIFENPNIAEGILLVIIAFSLLLSLFIFPYIIFCFAVTIIIIALFKHREKIIQQKSQASMKKS